MLKKVISNRVFILFAIRLLTAIVMSVYLAKLNVWSDSFSNSVFAIGYRVFLILTPLAFFFFQMRIISMIIVIGFIGVLLSFYSVNLVVVILVSFSLAISGYLTKLFLATANKGVAYNKIALNIGTSIAGGMILLNLTDNTLLIILLLLMFTSLVFAYFVKLDEASLNINQANTLKIKKDTIGWLFIGVATGIKFIAVFTILAQYIIKHNGTLPHWFGAMIIINSIVVIFFQKYIIVLLTNRSFTFVSGIMLFAMILIALPNIFGASYIWGAGIWVLLLSLCECGVTMFDKLSASNGSLIYKEIAVGLGGGIAVFLSREFSNYIYLSGLLGAVLVILAYINIKWVNYQ